MEDLMGSIVSLKAQMDGLDDAIAGQLRATEHALKELQIGIHFAVAIYGKTTLHYKKEKNAWGLFIFSPDEEGRGNFLPLLNAPRGDRLAAAKAMPALLTQIEKSLADAVAQRGNALQSVTQAVNLLKQAKE